MTAIPVAERTYSPQNDEPALCELPDGHVAWTAWAAFGKQGSRCFARPFDGDEPGKIIALSDHDCTQTWPLVVADRGRARFVWLEKTGQTYSVWSRIETDAPVQLWTLPDAAKPYNLTAATGRDGALWVAWAESTKGDSAISALRCDADVRHTTRRIGPYNYRPKLVGHGAGAYLVWDAYIDRTYHVFGCALPDGEPVRISRDDAWENRADVCVDRDGILWCVWVHCRDAIYQDSTIHQFYHVRGARVDGGAWTNVGEIVSLNYGLLPPLPQQTQLGHQGRRLCPMIRGATEGSVWLMYECKADDLANTLKSLGRFVGMHFDGERWSAPLNMTEGRVWYEPPHGMVGDALPLLSRDIEWDELHFERMPLHQQLPAVPETQRTVDLTHWRPITLPTRSMTINEQPRNELPGDEQGRYQLFWADLHCHSSVSPEMDGTPDELGHFARDKANIDALTVSDNENFWRIGVRNQARYITEVEWDMVKGNAMTQNAPARFAMFPGFEMTIGDGTDRGRDHRSVMSDVDEMELDRFMLDYHDDYWSGKRRFPKDTREALAWYKARGYLALPHPHNGCVNFYDADVEWGIDLSAAWMINFELYDVYFKLLEAGHRYAFTGSGDSHHRNPGLSGALTGIWATELTRKALLEAIRARRTFATAGARIAVEFTINDHMMGSAIEVRDDPTLRWRVVGEDQPYILRIHRAGRLMHEQRFDGRTSGEVKEFKLHQYRPGPHYYYLEVTTDEPVPQYASNVAHAQGQRAWSTPIWVEPIE